MGLEELDLFDFAKSSLRGECDLSSVNTWVGKHQGQITAREAT